MVSDGSGPHNTYVLRQSDAPSFLEGSGSDRSEPIVSYTVSYLEAATNGNVAHWPLAFNLDGSFNNSNFPFGFNDCTAVAISQLISEGRAFYYVRSSSPKVLPDADANRKSVDESVANSATLQNDDQLVTAIKSGKTYVVEGTVFVSSTSATPDIKVAFTAPSGSDITIGYTSNAGAGSSGVLTTSGAASTRIPLPANSPVPIRIEGTIVAGADGTLQLQWAQFASNIAAVTVGKGSYLEVAEI
jgi:hypothetical protein